MKRFLLVSLLLPAIHGAAPPAPFDNEQLAYYCNWPSGLNLGEGQLKAKRKGSGWDLELTIDAAIPAFAVKDKFHSLTGPDFTSIEFERDTAHGKKTDKDKTAFDANGHATRTGGAPSDLPDGARDALAFLYYTRQQLGQGRVPPPQTVVYGAAYTVREEYTGAKMLRIGDKRLETDGIAVHAKGKTSTFDMDIYFARDAGRTPVVIKVPLSLGVFSMELVRLP
jgi:hypothetical protein